MKRPLTPESQ